MEEAFNAYVKALMKAAFGKEDEQKAYDLFLQSQKLTLEDQKKRKEMEKEYEALAQKIEGMKSMNVKKERGDLKTLEEKIVRLHRLEEYCHEMKAEEMNITPFGLTIAKPINKEMTRIQHALEEKQPHTPRRGRDFLWTTRGRGRPRWRKPMPS